MLFCWIWQSVHNSFLYQTEENQNIKVLLYFFYMRSCGYIVPPQTSVHKSQNHWNLIAQKDHFPSLRQSPHNFLTLHLVDVNYSCPQVFIID